MTGPSSRPCPLCRWQGDVQPRCLRPSRFPQLRCRVVWRMARRGCACDAERLGLPLAECRHGSMTSGLSTSSWSTSFSSIRRALELALRCAGKDHRRQTVRMETLQINSSLFGLSHTTSSHYQNRLTANLIAFAQLFQISISHYETTANRIALSHNYFT